MNSFTLQLLNPIERSTQEFPGQELIAISDLESAEPTRNISGTPDLTLYLVLNFSEGGAPQINGITFAYPHSPFVSQWEFTNNTCTGETAEKHCINGRCVCSYVQKAPTDSLLEIVVVDTSKSSFNIVDKRRFPTLKKECVLHHLLLHT